MAGTGRRVQGSGDDWGSGTFTSTRGDALPRLCTTPATAPRRRRSRQRLASASMSTARCSLKWTPVTPSSATPTTSLGWTRTAPTSRQLQTTMTLAATPLLARPFHECPAPRLPWPRPSHLKPHQPLEVEGRSENSASASSGFGCWRLRRRRCGPHGGVGCPGAQHFLLTGPATAAHSPGCSRSGSAPRSGFRFLAATGLLLSCRASPRLDGRSAAGLRLKARPFRPPRRPAFTTHQPGRPSDSAARALAWLRRSKVFWWRRRGWLRHTSPPAP